ncbi:hypothetical protein [Desulfonema magnum]|uniref:Uncharacterized protein n=1 Tax=Desulfonema magnum TaxID=45655 RepID=A0A975BWQ5_9BACT|nr:hypothetical protein [Desulfonema magnum]QTA93141.1 Uncharacterized protein dnm_092380 [Desulfonema magnum]
MLARIAEVTGGGYFKVSTEAAAVYAIGRLYGKIARTAHGADELYDEELIILQDEVIERVFEIIRGTLSFQLERLIPGSDVETSLIQPDGTVIDRASQNSDVYHMLGATYEIYRIDNPMPGEWTVRLEGTDTSPGGEPTSLSVAAAMPDLGDCHSGDYKPADHKISFSELLRVIQLFNSQSYHCDSCAEDGYELGDGDTSCTPHDSDDKKLLSSV